MKKEMPTPLVDELLQSVAAMKQPETDPFFYTRLRARMDRETASSGWNFSLQPAWIIGTLVLLLLVNGITLGIRQHKTEAVSQSQPGIRDFALSYDQTVTTY